MTARRLTTFLGTITLLLGGMGAFLMPLEAGAQHFPAAGVDLPIGVTPKTVKHATVIRYGYFYYSPPSRTSSPPQAEAFQVGQPRYVLPAAHSPRSLAFNSPSADYMLSNMGVVVGTLFGGTAYQLPQGYNDKYSLSIRAKP